MNPELIKVAWFMLLALNMLHAIALMLIHSRLNNGRSRHIISTYDGDKTNALLVEILRQLKTSNKRLPELKNRLDYIWICLEELNNSGVNSGISSDAPLKENE